MTAPAIIVIGPVVDLREALSWFETKPLFGWRILVPRTKEQAGAMSDASIFQRATFAWKVAGLGAAGLHRTVWATPRTEIGYWCRKRFEGKGYITEAVNGITRSTAIAPGMCCMRSTPT